MHTIIICHRSIKFCDLLEDLLKKYEEIYDIDIVKFYTDDRMMEYCRNNRFDIIYLDAGAVIRNGVKTAKELKSINSEVQMIYIAECNDHYAYAKQDEAAVVIMKNSYDVEELERDIDHTLLDAVRNIFARTQFSFEFDHVGYRIIRDQIRYFYSEVKKIYIYGEKDHILSWYYGRMDELYGELQKTDNNFERVSKKCIVNMNYATVKNEKQIMVEEKLLPLTSKYRKKFLNKYYDKNK